MKTLREVCKMTGTNRQFLQRLAFKGKKKENNREPYLLPPSVIKGNGDDGNWYYDDAAIQRLWMILMFRELDGKLGEIEKIMHADDFDQNAWLKKQIELLENKRSYIDKLINAANMMLVSGIMPGDMIGDKAYTISEYLEMSESAQKISQEDMDKLPKALGDKAFNTEFKKLLGIMRSGDMYDTVKAQRTTGKMWQAFKARLGEGSKNGFLVLGQMFSKHGVFANKIDDRYGEGAAHYVGEAMITYCKRHSNMED